ncbi:MAG TPA: response regulator, partial [Myxococcaceae bacterium]|nr:response regulator [Myxococcaceae bacterium]
MIGETRPAIVGVEDENVVAMAQGRLFIPAAYLMPNSDEATPPRARSRNLVEGKATRIIDETKPSILVVEDENVVAMDLVASLEKLRYPVAGVVASGEEAVAVAERKAPGLVLMDIHLRGEMDGIRAAEQIQERFFIPVVYLTAYSDEATLDRARVTYPFGYILKPFEDREIEVAIQTALYRHKMEQAIRAGEKRLEAVLTSIGDAVIATDPATRIMFLNRAAETLLGWKSERARGRLLADVLKVAPQGEGVFRLIGAGPGSVLVELV